MLRSSIAAVLAASVLACSSGTTTPTVVPGGAPTAAPGGGPTSAPTAPPAATPGGQPAGDVESLVRALIPPGATEVNAAEVGGSYQVTLTSTMSVDQLKAFWEQAIPANGMTSPGSFTQDSVLTMAITNPDGGIVASPDESGGVTIVISLGLI